MKKFWGFLLVIVLMTSCGEYQSLLKSNDYNLVYKKAIEYYNKGDYHKCRSKDLCDPRKASLHGVAFVFAPVRIRAGSADSAETR